MKGPQSRFSYASTWFQLIWRRWECVWTGQLLSVKTKLTKQIHFAKQMQMSPDSCLLTPVCTRFRSLRLKLYEFNKVLENSFNKLTRPDVNDGCCIDWPHRVRRSPTPQPNGPVWLITRVLSQPLWLQFCPNNNALTSSRWTLLL